MNEYTYTSHGCRVAASLGVDPAAAQNELLAHRLLHGVVEGPLVLCGRQTVHQPARRPVGKGRVYEGATGARCETVFPVSTVVGAAVPAAVCRWGLCRCCPGVGRCLSGVYNLQNVGM